MIYLDTETCGFHGAAVLLQYAIDDGEVILYELWRNPIKETLELIRLIAEHPGGVCGFNLSYDWFHLCKIYTMFNAYPDHDVIPYNCIKEVAKYEKDARDGPCLKPVAACDLMFHARKGKYQSTMERHGIYIRRVPKALAKELSVVLNDRIKLNPLYFARSKKQLDNPWQIKDIVDRETGLESKVFKDIVLEFNPSTALKALAQDALGIETQKFVDVACKIYPEEVGWAPFADAIEPHQKYRKTWPACIDVHIRHWSNHVLARKYATDDVVYLQKLYPVFGSPAPGDVDSDLACSVAAVRWRGFKIDLEKVIKLRETALENARKIHVAPNKVKEILKKYLSPDEILSMGGSTKTQELEKLVRWTEHEDCNGLGCHECADKPELKHPVANIAQMIIDSRSARKEIELYDKLIQAGRLHAGFKVVGALSGRMAGDNKLNAQGIKATYQVRECFPLAHDGLVFCGGDFESFEVAIAAAVYKDEKLYEDLNQVTICAECAGKKEIKNKRTGLMVTCPDCKGKGQSKAKIHGLFASVMFDKTYEEVIASKASKRDMYKKGKSGLFSQLYGGNEQTFITRLAVTPEEAKRAATNWGRRYPDIGKSQKRIFDMFCSMRQIGGIGSKIEWHEPADFMPSLLGFKRFFTLENQICRTLFKLAEDPPKEWTNLRITVRRRDRDQSVSGAVKSALFAAAFQIQAANLRASQNHEIQSTGAEITKQVQHEIWKQQPAGVHEWHVMPMNIHDEILAPCKPELQDTIESVVKTKVKTYADIVPLISIDWKKNMETWADK